MTGSEATAEVFWRAFRTMSQSERRAFVERMLANRALRHDLLDAALIEERKGEPKRPLEEALSDLDAARDRRRK